MSDSRGSWAWVREKHESSEMENKRDDITWPSKHCFSNQFSRRKEVWTKTDRWARWVGFFSPTGMERNSCLSFSAKKPPTPTLLLSWNQRWLNHQSPKPMIQQSVCWWCLEQTETVQLFSDTGWGGAAAGRLCSSGLPLHEESHGITLPCTREAYQS